MIPEFDHTTPAQLLSFATPASPARTPLSEIEQMRGVSEFDAERARLTVEVPEYIPSGEDWGMGDFPETFGAEEVRTPSGGVMTTPVAPPSGRPSIGVGELIPTPEAVFVKPAPRPPRPKRRLEVDEQTELDAAHIKVIEVVIIAIFIITGTFGRSI